MVFLPRWPATYLDAWTARMLDWFTWLDVWGKTPLDLGLTPEERDELDPRYPLAMKLLKREFSRLERERLDELKKEK